MEKICDELEVPTKSNRVDIGVRVELPAELFSHLTDCPFFRIVSAQFGSEPLEQLWKRAAAAQPIPEQARLALASLGSVLGRCGAQRQSDEIALTRCSLTAAADALEREIAERTRRYPVLGAALGAIIATLLF